MYEAVPCKYELERDIQSRLHQTICRYSGRPVYVAVEPNSTLALYDPWMLKSSYGGASKADPMRVKAQDPLFDMSSPELGYVIYNYEKEHPQVLKAPSRRNASGYSGDYVFYTMRTPVKQWRQGLSGDGMAISGLGQNGASSWLSPGNILISFALVDALTNNYPTLDSVLSKFDAMNEAEGAISKDIALAKTPSGIVQVYLKQVNVGFMLPDSDVVRMKNTKTSWVAEAFFDKAGVKVA